MPKPITQTQWLDIYQMIEDNPSSNKELEFAFSYCIPFIMTKGTMKWEGSRVTS